MRFIESDAPNVPCPSARVAFARSAQLLRARPFVLTALGGGVLASFFAICCGVGLFAAPLFLTEMLGTQLEIAVAEERRLPRARIKASFFLLCAVVILASGAWLATLFFAPETPLPIGPSEPADWLDIGTALAFAAAGTSLSLAFIGPFLYAPLVLLDRGGTIGGVAIESARLVARGGVLKHMSLSAAANAVQFAPAIIAAIVSARFVEPTAAPLAVALSLPFLALTIPLGQGMVVAAYEPQRATITEGSRTRPEGRPPRRLTIAWSALLLAPVIALGLSGVSLTRASRVARGSLPRSELVADHAVRGTDRVSFFVPDALEVTATTRSVVVAASDGGGTGSLPLPSRGAISRIRVGRVGDVYALEVTAGGAHYCTRIDRAGVRLDDDLRTRLLDRVPVWGILAILALLAALGAANAMVLPPLGEARRASSLDPPARPTEAALVAFRDGAVQRAWRIAGLLAPLALLAVCASIVSLVD